MSWPPPIKPQRAPLVALDILDFVISVSQHALTIAHPDLVWTLEEERSTAEEREAATLIYELGRLHGVIESYRSTVSPAAEPDSDFPF